MARTPKRWQKNVEMWITFVYNHMWYDASGYGATRGALIGLSNKMVVF